MRGAVDNEEGSCPNFEFGNFGGINGSRVSDWFKLAPVSLPETDHPFSNCTPF